MNLSKLGDVFWIYILMNVFSGAIWSPFLHLSSCVASLRCPVLYDLLALTVDLLFSLNQQHHSAPLPASRLTLCFVCIPSPRRSHLSLPSRWVHPRPLASSPGGRHSPRRPTSILDDRLPPPDNRLLPDPILLRLAGRSGRVDADARASAVELWDRARLRDALARAGRPRHC